MPMQHRQMAGLSVRDEPEREALPAEWYVPYSLWVLQRRGKAGMKWTSASRWFGTAGTRTMAYEDELFF